MSKTTELVSIPNHVATFLNTDGLVPVGRLHELTIEQRVNEAAKGMQISIAAHIYAGFALLSAKESVPHGEFTTLAQSYGFNRARVSRCCRLAKLTLRLPSDKCPALGMLTPTHWLAIESWSDDALALFVSGERVYGITLDEAGELGTRAFKEAISDSIETRHSDRNRMLESTVDTQTNRIEQLEKEAAHLNQQLGTLKKTHAIPAYIPEVQEESSVIAEAFSNQLDMFPALARQLQERQADCSQDPHLQDGWQNAAVTLHLNAQRMAAKATQALQQLESCLPEEVLMHSGAGIHLTAEQAETILSRSDSILNELSQQRDSRHKTRLDAQPRGRGRPRKDQE